MAGFFLVVVVLFRPRSLGFFDDRRRRPVAVVVVADGVHDQLHAHVGDEEGGEEGEQGLDAAAAVVEPQIPPLPGLGPQQHGDPGDDVGGDVRERVDARSRHRKVSGDAPDDDLSASQKGVGEAPGENDGRGFAEPLSFSWFDVHLRSLLPPAPPWRRDKYAKFRRLSSGPRGAARGRRMVPAAAAGG